MLLPRPVTVGKYDPGCRLRGTKRFRVRWCILALSGAAVGNVKDGTAGPVFCTFGDVSPFVSSPWPLFCDVPPSDCIFWPRVGAAVRRCVGMVGMVGVMG